MPGISRSAATMYLIFLVFIWGINWPLTKYALDFSPPLLFAGIRTLIGGILLVGFAIWKRGPLRLKQNWLIYLIASMLNIIMYYSFQTIGLQYMPAGLFTAIVFLQPVLLGVFAWLWLGEAMYPLKIIGLLLGFAGVAAITTGGISGHISVWGLLLAIVSAISWAGGTIYTKKMAARVDSLWMTAMQVAIGGVVILGTGSMTESWSDIVWNMSFIFDTLFISIFVIAIGWLIYFKLIRNGDSAKVGSFMFLIPLIAIVFSVLFLNEHVTINLAVGLALVASSIIVVNRKPRRLKKELPVL
ncbi:DMT family transporter [Paenibacillus algorifonticola]|uniref:DMT family transporter n=1 Tax=Paenibacillus algorifonticola TaxID=684063 RepID=UPI003D28B293